MDVLWIQCGIFGFIYDFYEVWWLDTLPLKAFIIVHTRARINVIWSFNSYEKKKNQYMYI